MISYEYAVLFWYRVICVLSGFCSISALADDSLNAPQIQIDPPLPELTQSPDTLGAASTKQNYFYHGQNYGSESQFGPLNVWLNVGLVVPGRLGTQPQLRYIDWDEGWNHVEGSITNQRDVFKESGGTQESLDKEFIPFSHPSGAWLPNYFLHFLGEGMLSRKLEEYHLYQGDSPMQAKIKAIATTVFSQFTNEVVEHELPWEQRLDPLADFYFNLAGIVAFSFDGVAELMSNEYVDYYYWPGQAMIDPQDGAIFNQGEQYYLRSNLGLFSDIKLAVMAGMPASAIGASFTLNESDRLSVMWGTDVGLSKPHEKVEKLERKSTFTAKEIADLYNRSLNLYWDRKGSLMGSAVLSYDPYAQLRLNLYPDTYAGASLLGLPLDDIGIGGYLLASEEGASSIGVTFSFTPVMFGYRW